MENYSFDLNCFELTLTLNKFNENADIIDYYIFDLDYTYLIDKEVRDEERKIKYNEDIFAYVLNRNASIKKNDIEIKNNDFEDPDILNTLKEIIIISSEEDRNILNQEDFFKNYFLILNENMNKEILSSIKYNKLKK